MTDDSAEIERIKAEVRAEVALLTAAGQPGQLRRIVEEREPRVVRKPRILYHELEPVWDVGELVVTAVELTAGVFTDETTQMRMGISVHSELLSITQPTDRTTHYDYANADEARKALEALRAIAREYDVSGTG